MKRLKTLVLAMFVSLAISTTAHATNVTLGSTPTGTAFDTSTMQDIIRAWHYSDGSWHLSSDYPGFIKYLKDSDSSIQTYTATNMKVRMPVPSNVQNLIDAVGINNVRYKVEEGLTGIVSLKTVQVDFSRSYFDITFSGKLNFSGANFWGTSGKSNTFLPVPKNYNYGCNWFSVTAKGGSSKLGAVATGWSANDISYGQGELALSGGRLNLSPSKTYTIQPDVGNEYNTAADLSVEASVSSGGAQAFWLYYPFKITWYYTENDITTKYIDMDSNTSIATDTVRTKLKDGTYPVTATSVTGYTLKGYKNEFGSTILGTTSSYNVPVKNSANVTVYYLYSKEIIKNNNITTKYVDAYGNSIAANNKQENIADGDYIVAQQAISGYSPIKYKDSTGSITDYSSSTIYKVTVAGGQAKTVTFIYNKSSLSNITTKYVDMASNASIATDNVQTSLKDGTYSVTAASVAGYTLKGYKNESGSTTLSTTSSYNVPVKNSANIVVFYLYSKDTVTPPPPVKDDVPPIIKLYAPETVHQGNSFTVSAAATDPQGYKIISYDWSVDDGQNISGPSGSLTIGATPISVRVSCVNEKGMTSNVDSAIITPYNNPPSASISIPSTITLGDDALLNINCFDKDNDSITENRTIPADTNGTVGDTGGTIYFMGKDSLGIKTFKVTAIDKFGLISNEATCKTTVIAPMPTVKLNISGYLKENRKISLRSIATSGSERYVIDNSKTEWHFFNDDGSSADNLFKTLTSFTGNESLDMICKKAGRYTVKITVFNNLGNTATASQQFIVEPDEAPICKPVMARDNYRDPNNVDSQGHMLFTVQPTDLSYSNDGDTIAKRIWIMNDDVNNNLLYDDQLIIWDSGQWKNLKTFLNGQGISNATGTWTDIRDGLLDLDKVNDGNCPIVTWKTPYVGNVGVFLIVREEFGEPTIAQLITSQDKKTSGLDDFKQLQGVNTAQN